MAAIPIANPDVSLAATPGWSIRATPAAFCRLALWAFVLIVVTKTSADPDLWGHLRFGLDTLASQSARAADLYSFTSDRAWINHEWLSELLMGISYAGLGALGLNLLKLAAVTVVGDTPSDIEAARAVGVPMIALATGIFSFADLKAHDPDACFDCATDLLALAG
jgi:hypothetical protein